MGMWWRGVEEFREPCASGAVGGTSDNTSQGTELIGGSVGSVHQKRKKPSYPKFWESAFRAL